MTLTEFSNQFWTGLAEYFNALIRNWFCGAIVCTVEVTTLTSSTVIIPNTLASLNLWMKGHALDTEE